MQTYRLTLNDGRHVTVGALNPHDAVIIAVRQNPGFTLGTCFEPFEKEDAEGHETGGVYWAVPRHKAVSAVEP